MRARAVTRRDDEPRSSRRIALAGGGWRTIGASALGFAHRRMGVACSQVHRAVPTPDDGVLLGVASGSQHAAESTLAAHIALAAALRPFARRASGPDQLRTTLVARLAAARGALHAVAGALGLPVTELATSLLLCQATRAGVAFGGVGDGFLVVRARVDGGHRHSMLRAPGFDDGDPAALESDGPLVVETIDDHAIEGLAIDGLALATGGLRSAVSGGSDGAEIRHMDALFCHADGAGDSDGLHEQLAREWWDELSKDDRSIVMAVRA